MCNEYITINPIKCHTNSVLKNERKNLRIDRSVKRAIWKRTFIYI